MYDVFLSYRRSDGMLLAQKIYDYLTVKGLRVFLDREKMEDSQYFNTQIVDRLTEAPHYILLATPDVFPFREGEDWVREEIKLALKLYEAENGNRSFGVILPQGSEFPYSDLPNGYENLGKPNQIQLKGSLPDSDELRRILRAVTAVNRHNLWNAGHRWLENSKKVGGRFATLRIDESIMPVARTEKSPHAEMPINVYEKNADVSGRVQKCNERPILDAIGKTKGNIYLIGQGGIGKTTSLVWIMDAAYENQVYSNTSQIPLFIELSHAPDIYGRFYEDGHSSFIRRAVYHLIRADRSPRQLTRKIVEEIDDIFNADPDISVKPVTDLFTAQTSAPEYLLLLDGLNEVSRREISEVNCTVVQMLVEEIRLLEECPNVRIVLTSRSDEEAITGNITRLYLSGIEDDVISEYMHSKETDEKKIKSALENRDLLEILRIPLFLTLYSCLYDKENITTRGEILRNFFNERRTGLGSYTAQSRIAEVGEDIKNSGRLALKKRIDVEMQYFMLDFILPEIAWSMEKYGEFYLGIEEIQGIIEPVLVNEGDKDLCGRYGKKLFSKYRNGASAMAHTKRTAESILALGDTVEDTVEVIIECCVFSLGFMQENYGNYGFVHQHIRDYFAAVRNINSMRMAVYLQEQGVASAFDCLNDFNDMIISVEVSRFIGEYLGEHNNNSVEENGTWKCNIPQEPCERNLIMRALNLYREKFNGESKYGVRNLLDIICESRRSLSATDLSRLDLSLCRLNRIGLYGADLSGSIVAHDTLFPDGHSGWIKKVIYSSDGKYILTADGEGIIKLWDANLLKVIRTLKKSSGMINDIVYSRDGSYLAISTGFETEIWDAKTYQYLTVIKSISNSHVVAFSPDGQYIAITSYSMVKIWDIRAMQCVGKLRWYSTKMETLKSMLHLDRIAFSLDGRFIAATDSYRNGVVKVWHVKTFKCVGELKHIDDVSNIAFSSDNRFIITASRNNIACIWDAKTYEFIYALEGHSDVVSDAKFILDNKFIVTSSEDCSIKIWDAKTFQCIKTLKGYSEANSIDCSPSGNHIVVAFNDATAKIWDINTFQCVGVLNSDLRYLSSAAYSPDGNLIILSSADNNAQIWDAHKCRYVNELVGHFYKVAAAVYSPDGRFISTASWDMTAKVWDSCSFQCLYTLEGHAAEVGSVSYSLDGKFIVTASDDATAKIWSTENYKCIGTLEGHRSWVRKAVFSPDGHYIVTCSRDETVKIWESHSQKCIQTLTAYQPRYATVNIHADSAVYSPDGRHILMGCNDGSIEIFDAGNYQLEGILKRNFLWVYSVSCRGDGQLIAASSTDPNAKIWDAKTHKCVGVLKGEWKGGRPKGVRAFFHRIYRSIAGSSDGHCGRISSVEFSPDNQMLLTSSLDGTAKIWDANTYKCKHTLKFVPGLQIKKTDLRDLHPDSNLSEEDREIMEMYGAILD